MNANLPRPRPQRGPLVHTRPPVVAARIIDHPAADLVPLTGGRVLIVGTVAQISAQLRVYIDAGRLHHTSAPAPDGRPGIYAVTAHLTPPVQPRPDPAGAPMSGRRLAGTVIAVVVALAGLGFLVVTAMAWLVAHLIVVGLGAAGVLLIGTRAGRRACRTVVTVTHHH